MTSTPCSCHKRGQAPPTWLFPTDCPPHDDVRARRRLPRGRPPMEAAHRFGVGYLRTRPCGSSARQARRGCLPSEPSPLAPRLYSSTPTAYLSRSFPATTGSTSGNYSARSTAWRIPLQPERCLSETERSAVCPLCAVCVSATQPRALTCGPARAAPVGGVAEARTVM